jgi:hypothetical protein
MFRNWYSTAARCFIVENKEPKYLTPARLAYSSGRAGARALLTETGNAGGGGLRRIIDSDPDSAVKAKALKELCRNLKLPWMSF